MLFVKLCAMIFASARVRRLGTLVSPRTVAALMRTRAAPGVTVRVLVPSELMESSDVLGGPLADGDDDDDHPDADDDPQQGERGPHLIARQAAEGDLEAFQEVHGGPFALLLPPKE